MEDCLFCKGKEDKEKIVLENEYAFVMFDEFPVNKGHMLFMTKRHVKDFFGTTTEEKNAMVLWHLLLPRNIRQKI